MNEYNEDITKCFQSGFSLSPHACKLLILTQFIQDVMPLLTAMIFVQYMQHKLTN
jgi:hypothetical protein